MTRRRGESSGPDIAHLPAVHWHVPMSRDFHALAWDACEAAGFASFAGFVRDAVARRIEELLPVITAEEALALTPRMGHKYWLHRQNMLRKADGTFEAVDADDGSVSLP